MVDILALETPARLLSSFISTYEGGLKRSAAREKNREMHLRPFRNNTNQFIREHRSVEKQGIYKSYLYVQIGYSNTWLSYLSVQMSYSDILISSPDILISYHNLQSYNGLSGYTDR